MEDIFKNCVGVTVHRPFEKWPIVKKLLDVIKNNRAIDEIEGRRIRYETIENDSDKGRVGVLFADGSPVVRVELDNDNSIRSNMAVKLAKDTIIVWLKGEHLKA